MTDQSIAIIGTREPDDSQFKLAEDCASVLSEMGWKIRTGGAFGIDQASMIGAAAGKLEVYLPWATYNRQIVPAHAIKIIYSQALHKEWADSVFKHHPAPGKLSNGAFLLHARNYGIVHGCTCVLAMPNADGGGGTGQGIRVARALNIPLIQVNKGQATMSLQTLLSDIEGTVKEKAA